MGHGTFRYSVCRFAATCRWSLDNRPGNGEHETGVEKDLRCCSRPQDRYCRWRLCHFRRTLYRPPASTQRRSRRSAGRSLYSRLSPSSIDDTRRFAAVSRQNSRRPVKQERQLLSTELLTWPPRDRTITSPPIPDPNSNYRGLVIQYSVIDVYFETLSEERSRSCHSRAKILVHCERIGRPIARSTLMRRAVNIPAAGPICLVQAPASRGLPIITASDTGAGQNVHVAPGN